MSMRADGVTIKKNGEEGFIPDSLVPALEKFDFSDPRMTNELMVTELNKLDLSQLDLQGIAITFRRRDEFTLLYK